MRRGAWVIAVWVAGLVLACLLIVRTPFSTDMSAFLPRSPTPAQQLLVEQLREGVVSRLVLVAVEGAPQEALAPISRGLAARLRLDDHFSVVNNGDQTAMTAEAGIVLRHRFLLSPAVTPQRFTEAALHDALLADIAMLGTDLAPVVKRMLASDPTGETMRLLQDVTGRSHPRSRDGVWVSRDGASALLTVSARAPGFDIDAQERGLDYIRAAFADTLHDMPHMQGARLVLTGPPVFAVQSRARIKSDAERLSIIATVLVAGVLLLAYRSPRMLVLGLLPVATGALAGVAAVGGVFGFVHGITLGFGVTLIGEAVDYAIYLFTQTQPQAAPRDTLKRIWPTLRLGMAISVCGFSAMLLSDFTGFAQLGLFTIVGLLTALAVTRFVLPVLMPAGFSAVGSARIAAPVLALIRHRLRLRWVVLVATMLAGASLVLHAGPYGEDELSSMSPIPRADMALDARLRGELGAPDVRTLLVVEAASREAALEASERAAAQADALVASGVITGFDAPGRWLPSQAVQSARRAALPEAAVLQENLARAVAGTGLRGDIFGPFLADVAAARSGALLQRADLDATSLALQVDSLLLRNGGKWAGLLPLSGVTDQVALAASVAAMGEAGVVFLDLKQESDNLLRSYRAEALMLSGAGGAVILLLLAVSLRTPRRIAAVVLPLVAALICTAALVLGFNERLSIFNLFGLLLVVAVGSNYILFFARAEADLPRMVASLVLADLCTVIGFGILSASSVPVLHGIGGTVAIGAFLSLVFGAVLSARTT